MLTSFRQYPKGMIAVPCINNLNLNNYNKISKQTLDWTTHSSSLLFPSDGEICFTVSIYSPYFARLELFSKHRSFSDLQRYYSLLYYLFDLRVVTVHRNISYVFGRSPSHMSIPPQAMGVYLRCRLLRGCHERICWEFYRDSLFRTFIEAI